VNSIAACCHSAKLCTHATWAFPIATHLSPNPVLILNFKKIYSPVAIQFQQNLL